MLPTLYDGRTNHARTVLETITDTYDLEVIEPPIPKTIKFAEAPAAGRSILATSRSSKGAKAYREVATHLVERAAAAAGRSARAARSEPAPRHPAASALRADGSGRRVARGHRWSRCWAGSGCCPCRRARRTRPGDTPHDPAGGRHRSRRAPTRSSDAGATKPKTTSQGNGTSADATESQVDPQVDAALPEGSGTGKRVVFSESRQRVWLVNEDEQIERTLPRLGQRLRQPRPRHLQRLLTLRGRLGRRRLGQHEVLRPLHPGRHRCRHRLPRHPDQGRRARPDRGPARHAA